MPTLADIRMANAIGAQNMEQNQATARSVIDSLSPYIDYLNVEDPNYMNMSKEKFDNLLDNDKQKLITLLNSSPVATSYKDITTKETKKGRIVDVIDDNGKISFAIQGEQGIVPKTLGFSNDPQDIVMFTDREGLRTMANTILQGQSNRLTSARKGYGSRALANATLQGVRLNDRLEQAESIPEAMGIIEQGVEDGELEPAQGFEMLIQMGSDYNDNLDAYRQKLMSDLADNKAERTRLEKIGEPGQKVKFGTGSSGSMGDGSAGRIGNPPVYEPTGRNAEEQAQYEKAVKEKESLRGRLRDSELVFPLYSNPETMFNFIKQNEDLMIEVGGDQNILNKARAAFNKYQVATPEDLNKIPDYDASIDISKAEIAAALAVAAGGENFTQEFNNSLRLLTTGDAGLTTMDVQKFDRESQNMNLRLAQYMRESEARIANLSNDKAKEIATRINSELGNLVNNVTDGETGMFVPEKFKGKGSVNFRNIVNAYDEANRLGLFNGAEGMEIDGYFRNALGTTLFNLIRAEGEASGIKIPVLDITLFGAPDQDMPLGDVTASLRAKYQETKDGQQVLKEIIAVDSQGRQVGKALSGKKYADLFNDTTTLSYVSRYITEIPGN